MSAPPFVIVYTEKAAGDVSALRPFDQKKVIEGVDTHLSHESTKVSRSRIKRMVQPFWSQYRLRVDDYRVYYDVNEATRMVTILRVLEKGRGSTPQEVGQ
jgi:mRNA-degrading endonuclease RelE of RelBE toxin-antitoxin system